MSNTMEYKGYIGSVEFSAEDACFFGKVLGVRAAGVRLQAMRAQ